MVAFTSDYAASATCSYDQSSNRVSCGGVTCSTIGQVQGGKLPTGYYRIGTFYHHGSAGTPWFNLYHQRSAGGFWDYYTKASDIGCRGGFGLHPGTVSLGCITVKNRGCFDRIKAVITRYSPKKFDVTECLSCLWGGCRRGTNTIRGDREYLTDLRVVA